jgi:arylsulfatase A-like enzyme
MACGAAAGAAIWMLRRRAETTIEAAATLTVVLAFGIHVVLWRTNSTSRYWLLTAVVVFAACLLVSRLGKQVGWLTNAWIVSGLLLGFGQELGLKEMGVASQLGAPLGKATVILAALLAGGTAGAILLGRRFRLPAAPLGYGAIGGAVLLMLASFALGRAEPASAAAAPGGLAATGRPNVLLIVLDTVHAAHLAVNGYERDTTPNLRDLARDSMVYRAAISASDITPTAHASLFTGMYPSWHGAYCDPKNAAFGRPLSKQYPTLAELLKAGGYRTTGVSANLYLRTDFGLARGFDQFRIPRPVPILAVENGCLLRGTVRRVLSLVFDTAQFDRLYSLGQDTTSALLAELAGPSRPGAPVFAFANYMDAHFPYVPPAPYDTRYPGRHAGTTQDDLEQQQYALISGKGSAGDYGAHCISQYDGGIAYLDRQIGEVVTWLKRSGAYDNTMIVITSDHGEAFGERNRVEHGNSPYQNVLNVALVVKYPGQAHRGTEERPVSLTDVAPTILRAAGLAVPPAMQGRGLTSAADREIFSETFPCPVPHPPDCPNGCTARAIFQWPYKFITSSNGRRELFDLGSDPAEKRNLYIQQPERAAQMGASLAEWMKSMPRQSSEKHTMSPEDLQRLKSLGYVQ